MTAQTSSNKPRSCFAHQHMTPAEFGVYSYAAAVSHDSGVFYLSHEIENAFAGRKWRGVYKIVASLEKKGWFVVTSASDRSSRGIWTSTQYSVLDHDAWVKSHTKKCPVHQSTQDKITSAPEYTGDTQPVHQSASTSAPGYTHPVHQGTSSSAPGCTKVYKEEAKGREVKEEKSNAPIPSFSKPTDAGKISDTAKDQIRGMAERGYSAEDISDLMELPLSAVQDYLAAYLRLSWAGGAQ